MPVVSKFLRATALAGALLAAVAGCDRGDVGDPGAVATAARSTGSAAERHPESSGPPRVAVDAQDRLRLGIELATVGATDLKAVARGTAIVLDGAALVAQLADLDVARADAVAAREAYARLDRLYRDGGNASRQARDAARVQSVTADAHVTAAVAHARFEWGSRVIDATDAAAVSLRAAILQGEVTLARAEFPERLPVDAARMQYQLPDSHDDGPETVTYVEQSRAAVQSIQGTGVLIAIASVPARPSLLRPGERRAVIAVTEAGSTRAVVPAAAAVADGGRLWCYVARGDTAFERISLDAEGQVDAGFPANGPLAVGDLVVVRGAPILLSLERGSAPGSAADE